jgi:hypothetical protein
MGNRAVKPRMARAPVLLEKEDVRGVVEAMAARIASLR